MIHRLINPLILLEEATPSFTLSTTYTHYKPKVVYSITKASVPIAAGYKQHIAQDRNMSQLVFNVLLQDVQMYRLNIENLNSVAKVVCLLLLATLV